MADNGKAPFRTINPIFCFHPSQEPQNVICPFTILNKLPKCRWYKIFELTVFRKVICAVGKVCWGGGGEGCKLEP